MKTYAVGGQVRDRLLGLEPKDLDYVVVGATVEEMLETGLTLIHASKFPVFIHPANGAEYALARTEKKMDVGYKGFECMFSPEVTLEEDLLRRDLTINAIAKDLETGEYIDPYDGILDLENKILKPVSDSFGDDPLRALRAARFLARYPEFEVTLELTVACAKASKEFKYLPKERIWMEMEKALKSPDPKRFFGYTHYFTQIFDGEHIFEELYNLKQVCLTNEFHQEGDAYIHTMMVVDKAKELFDDPEIVFAGVMHDLGKAVCFHEFGHLHGHEEAGLPVVTEFCDTYKVPNSYRDLALITTKQHLKVHNILGRGKNAAAKPKSIMKLIQETSAMAHPERFEKMLKACESDAKGRIGKAADADYTQRPYLMECLEAVNSVDTKPISKELLEKEKDGKLIGEAIRVARIHAIKQVKIKWEKK